MTRSGTKAISGPGNSGIKARVDPSPRADPALDRCQKSPKQDSLAPQNLLMSFNFFFKKSTTVLECDVGYYRPVSTPQDNDCRACPRGTYKSYVGYAQECDPCPAGTTTYVPGATSASDCGESGKMLSEIRVFPIKFSIDSTKFLRYSSFSELNSIEAIELAENCFL